MTTKISCLDNADLPPSHQLVKLFWMLCPAYMRWAECHLQEEGLTPQRVQLMVLLKENGPMIMSGLSDELGVTAANITTLVDALEKDDRVFREPHPKDRRATVVDLTPSAKENFEANCAQFREKVSGLFDIFSEEEQKELLAYLHRIREALVERKILKF